ncbi:MAG TPA: hypothetical protein VGG64_28280 [Pirellulales bacterium]|jgi:hypothetical protein
MSMPDSLAGCNPVVDANVEAAWAKTVQQYSSSLRNELPKVCLLG